MEVENMETLIRQNAGNLNFLSEGIARRFETIGERQSALRLLGLQVGVEITVDAVIEPYSVVSLISHGIAH